jgi:hypothetical protein
MKELFKRLERYGPGWTLDFLIQENNHAMIVLEHFHRGRLRVYTEYFMLFRSMIDKWREEDYEEGIIVLDTMHQRITRVMNK